MLQALTIVQWATAFMRYNYMICPAFDLGSTAFSTITCQPNDVFVWRSLAIPENISKVVSTVVSYFVRGIRSYADPVLSGLSHNYTGHLSSTTLS